MTSRVEVSPEAQTSVRRLPGHLRKRVRRALRDLASDPRPPHSRGLSYPLPGAEPRRLRIDGWRILYAVIDGDPRVVAVLAIRRRPPYDYDDLDTLFGALPDR